MMIYSTAYAFPNLEGPEQQPYSSSDKPSLNAPGAACPPARSPGQSAPNIQQPGAAILKLYWESIKAILGYRVYGLGLYSGYNGVILALYWGNNKVILGLY